MNDTLEADMNWLYNCREHGTLNEWDIANAIDNTTDFHDLRTLLKFLIVEGMIKTWTPEETK